MQAGAITSYIDVAQVALYAFWIFFAGLIYYLRTEDKREGYPLMGDRADSPAVEGFPPVPRSKTFLLPHGGTQTAPRVEAPRPVLDAVPTAPWPGAPMQPLGDPLLAGVGPGSFALRSDKPDLTFDEGLPRLVPLRIATDHFLDEECPDPRGMAVVGADGGIAGRVADIWLDRPEMLVRYLEVTLPSHENVLLPMTISRIDSASNRVLVQSIAAAQFAHVPRQANPDQVTLLEEDKITAFFGGGTLYADPRRTEPLL